MLKHLKRIISRLERQGAERHLIQYREYIHDENGNRVLDEDGIPEFELKVCDIVGKSYKDLPDELKKRFNNFNINVTKFLTVQMNRLPTIFEITTITQL